MNRTMDDFTPELVAKAEAILYSSEVGDEERHADLILALTQDEIKDVLDYLELKFINT